MQNKIESGSALNYVAGGTIASGGVVVLGGYCGIAKTSAASGDTIALDMEGVFNLPKTNPLVITQGDKLYWNAGSQLVTKTNTDTVLGYAWNSALSADTTIQVWLAKW